MDHRFDVKSWLRSRGIPFKEEGKNTTSGWIEVCCPWCDDPSFHLGINLNNPFINCWRCGIKGFIIRYICFIEKCSREEAYHIITKFPDYSLPKLKSDILYRNTKDVDVLPYGVSSILSPLQRQYLINRKFDPDYLIKNYGIMSASNVGPDKFRVIIPIFLNGKIVSYTAMDPTGQMGQKYQHCSNERSIYPIKHLIYNLDVVRDTILIMEGVTDVWRIDRPGAIAVFGIEVTNEQILAIKEKNPLKIFVMFDGEPLAFKKSKKVAERLCGIFSKVEVIQLREGIDPGELEGEELDQVRKIF